MFDEGVSRAPILSEILGNYSEAKKVMIGKLKFDKDRKRPVLLL